jgi:hypothetical protein
MRGGAVAAAAAPRRRAAGSESRVRRRLAAAGPPLTPPHGRHVASGDGKRGSTRPYVIWRQRNLIRKQHRKRSSRDGPTPLRIYLLACLLRCPTAMVAILSSGQDVVLIRAESQTHATQSDNKPAQKKNQRKTLREIRAHQARRKVAVESANLLWSTPGVGEETEPDPDEIRAGRGDISRMSSSFDAQSPRWERSIRSKRRLRRSKALVSFDAHVTTKLLLSPTPDILKPMSSSPSTTAPQQLPETTAKDEPSSGSRSEWRDWSTAFERRLRRYMSSRAPVFIAAGRPGAPSDRASAPPGHYSEPSKPKSVERVAVELQFGPANGKGGREQLMLGLGRFLTVDQARWPVRMEVIC